MGKQAYRFSRTSNLMTGQNKLMMGFLYLFSSTLLLSKALEGAVTENSKSDRNLPSTVSKKKSSQFPDFFVIFFIKVYVQLVAFTKGFSFSLDAVFLTKLVPKRKMKKENPVFPSIFFMVL